MLNQGGEGQILEALFAISGPLALNPFDLADSPEHVLTGNMVVIHSKPLDLSLRPHGRLMRGMHDTLSFEPCTQLYEETKE